MDKMAPRPCHFDSGMFDIPPEMAIFATGKQSIIMKRFIYILLAAAVAVLTVSCKKDSKDGSPENSFTIDGKSMSIKKARIDNINFQEGNCRFQLFLSDRKDVDYVDISFDKLAYLGETIDLTEIPEEPTTGWRVNYYSDDNVFSASVCCEIEDTVFDSGTLFTQRLEDEDGIMVFHLELKNGKISNHTVSLHYEGKVDNMFLI